MFKPPNPPLKSKNKMVYNELSRIYLEEKDRKTLDSRKCIVCSKKLKRNQTECMEFWINRKFCCNKCKIKHRKKFGLIRYKNEYKVYNCVGDTRRESYVITIPKRIAEKFNLLGKRYEIKKVGNRLVIYVKTDDGGHKVRVITRHGNKNYYALNIPKKYVEKYNLYHAIFKCEVDSDKIIAYTKL